MWDSPFAISNYTIWGWSESHTFVVRTEGSEIKTTILELLQGKK